MKIAIGSKEFYFKSGILAAEFHYITFIIYNFHGRYEVDIYFDEDISADIIDLDTETFTTTRSQY